MQLYLIYPCVLVERVCSRFDEIEKFFNGMNDDIFKKCNLVNEIYSAFLNIDKNISEVVSVSEENSSSTEEIFAEIEGQKHKIINIQQSISQLDNLCNELED